MFQLPVAGRRRSGDEMVRRVVRVESTGEILRRKQAEMLVDGKELRLGVEMVDG